MGRFSFQTGKAPGTVLYGVQPINQVHRGALHSVPLKSGRGLRLKELGASELHLGFRHSQVNPRTKTLSDLRGKHVVEEVETHSTLGWKKKKKPRRLSYTCVVGRGNNNSRLSFPES